MTKKIFWPNCIDWRTTAMVIMPQIFMLLPSVQKRLQDEAQVTKTFKVGFKNLTCSCATILRRRVTELQLMKPLI